MIAARLLAAGIAVGALVVASASVSSAGSPAPCDLISAKDLGAVLDVRFEVLFTDDITLCSWASKVDEPSVEVDLTRATLSKETLADAKDYERSREEVTVLPRFGDLAVFSTQRSSPGTTTSQLVVFEGRDVLQINVTDSRDPSTRRQLRRLAAKALEEL